MRALPPLVAAVALAIAPLAQDVPPRGADATFDVATWNVEWFGDSRNGPSNDGLQVQNVAEVIRQAKIDLWALQEISDTADFNALLQTIENDGYRGVIFNPGGSNQRLAYVYNENVVTVSATTTVLAGNEFDFAGRLPFVLFGSATVGGQTQSIRVVNIHAKCCGDTNSYNRRVRAAAALKEYTDDQIERGRALILLGDFNDRLNVSTASGRLSPYRPFRSDPDYTIATFEIDRLNVPTFCSNSSCTSGTALDHILFSQDLAASYVEASGDRYIELVSAIDDYRETTSDHVPVVASFTLVPVSSETAPEAARVALLAPEPNPVREAATFRFRLSAPGPARVDVFDARGRRVAGASGTYASGESAVRVATGPLAPGVYAVRLAAGGEVRTRTFVRAR